MGLSPKEFFSSAANWFTLLRLALAPVLWALALKGNFTLVAYGLILVILTDVIDGQLARALGQCTRLGERLDSVADHLILISSVIWLMMSRMDILSAKRAFFIPTAILYVGAILLALIKNGRFGGAHLLEAKIFGVFGYLFLIVSYLGYDSDLIFYAAMASWVIHSGENILYLYRPDLFDPRFRSLVFGVLGIETKSKLLRFLF